jgi:DNA-binding transcriptional LysR family regulator
MNHYLTPRPNLACEKTACGNGSAPRYAVRPSSAWSGRLVKWFEFPSAPNGRNVGAAVREFPGVEGHAAQALRDWACASP